MYYKPFDVPLKEYEGLVCRREYWDRLGTEWRWSSVEEKIIRLAGFVQKGGNLKKIINHYAKDRDETYRREIQHCILEYILVLMAGDSIKIYRNSPFVNRIKRLDKDELVKELTKLLECEIIIIPTENDDMTGHADGMVRFVNKNTILVNNLEEEYKYWREGMQKVIEKYKLKYINLPFFLPKDSKHPLSAVGIYVNYLEVNNLIVLPVFGRDEDKQAIDIIQKTFPNKVIETIDYNAVALEGGLLNCTTWVIK